MNLFDLPVEIRQSIYNININEKCIILKNENEKNKNELLKYLNIMIKQHEAFVIIYSGYSFYESRKFFNHVVQSYY